MSKSRWNDSPTIWDWCRRKDADLLPCPFCGQPAILEFLLHPPTKSYWAECNSCGAKTDIGLTGEEAIKWWNRRVG
jgi:Lar family restriction alleviation protein